MLDRGTFAPVQSGKTAAVVVTKLQTGFDATINTGTAAWAGAGLYSNTGIDMSNLAGGLTIQISDPDLSYGRNPIRHHLRN